MQLPLVTQPMMQQRPNATELRSMDSYIQILCRFQKCKRKVPPPSLLCNEKSPISKVTTDLVRIFMNKSLKDVMYWNQKSENNIFCLCARFFLYFTLDT